jgi:hypothetical protein
MSSLFFYWFVRKTCASPTFENNNAAKRKTDPAAGRQAGRHQGFKTNMSLVFTNLQQRIRPRFVGANLRKEKKRDKTKQSGKQIKRLRSKKALPAATFSNNENDTTSTQNGIRATVVSVSVSHYYHHHPWKMFTMS